MNFVQMDYTFEFEFTRRYLHNFINFVSQIKSNVSFVKDGKQVNAKSIIGILSINIKKNDSLVIVVSGNDEVQISNDLNNVVKYLNSDTDTE